MEDEMSDSVVLGLADTKPQESSLAAESPATERGYSSPTKPEFRIEVPETPAQQGRQRFHLFGRRPADVRPPARSSSRDPTAAFPVSSPIAGGAVADAKVVGCRFPVHLGFIAAVPTASGRRICHQWLVLLLGFQRPAVYRATPKSDRRPVETTRFSAGNATFVGLDSDCRLYVLSPPAKTGPDWPSQDNRFSTHFFDRYS